MPRRPCLAHNCNSLAIPGKARCYTHQRELERQRGTRQQRGYDATYDQARAALHLEQRPPCHWCGNPASTADHWPPKAKVGPHTHLVPACDPCNSGQRALRAWNGLSADQRARLEHAVN